METKGLSEFRTRFESRYQDAPELAEELLYPLLHDGHDIHVVSAFVPSYILRLFELVRSNFTESFGFLNLTFFVPNDLTVKSLATDRLAQYFSRFVEFDGQILQFTNDGVQLFDAGAIGINLAYSKVARPVARGCALVVVDGGVRQDYVSLVDSKGGDWNSPLSPKRSWEPSQLAEAEEVLSRIAQFGNGDKTSISMLGPDETRALLSSTFAVLAESARQVEADRNAKARSLAQEDYDDLDFDETDEFEPNIRYLELLDGEIVDWIDDSDMPDPFGEDVEHIQDLLDMSEGLTQRVDMRETVDGHAPPLPHYLRAHYPVLYAVCPCGEVFNRAGGCPSFRE